MFFYTEERNDNERKRFGNKRKRVREREKKKGFPDLE